MDPRIAARGQLASQADELRPRRGPRAVAELEPRGAWWGILPTSCGPEAGACGTVAAGAALYYPSRRAAALPATIGQAAKG